MDRKQVNEDRLKCCQNRKGSVKSMTNEMVRKSGVESLLKCFLLVLVFGIVAMPPVGIYLAVTRKSIFGKILGLLLLTVGVASWTYLVLYSIRPH